MSNNQLSEFRKDALRAHNEKRARHGAPALKLSDDLNKYAQNWAEKLAAANQLEHSPCKLNGETLGENVATKWASNGSEMSEFIKNVDYCFHILDAVGGTVCRNSPLTVRSKSTYRTVSDSARTAPWWRLVFRSGLLNCLWSSRPLLEASQLYIELQKTFHRREERFHPSETCILPFKCL